jgi:hypothetical protein
VSVSVACNYSIDFFKNECSFTFTLCQEVCTLRLAAAVVAKTERERERMGGGGVRERKLRDDCFEMRDRIWVVLWAIELPT